MYERISVGAGSTGVDRRRHVRVVANGSVIVYGLRTTRGRLLDISIGGMCVRFDDTEPRFHCGEHADAELHLDRAGARWLRFEGEVVRVTEHEIAIAFTAVPLDLSDVVKDALASALESAAHAHVLLVDANTDRRGPFAALLRRAGCRVVETSTPLEAIAHLGQSAIRNWVVAIAATSQARAADELKRFLAEGDAPVDVRVLNDRSPTSALAWFTTTPRVT